MCSLEWQWDQLRVMKVGGNESATKFFQQNGGTAALNSKDPKTKYQSSAATKYKDELKRRAARDALEYAIPNTPNILNRSLTPMLDTRKKLLSMASRQMAAPPLLESLRMTSSHPGTSPRLRSRRRPYHELQHPLSSAAPHLLSSAPATRTFPVPRRLYQRQIRPSRSLRLVVSPHPRLCEKPPRPAAPRRPTSLVRRRCKSWA